MMKRVEHASSKLGDSNEPEVLQAKRDVAKTRTRAHRLIKKLDSFIGKYWNISIISSRLIVFGKRGSLIGWILIDSKGFLRTHVMTKIFIRRKKKKKSEIVESPEGVNWKLGFDFLLLGIGIFPLGLVKKMGLGMRFGYFLFTLYRFKC